MSKRRWVVFGGIIALMIVAVATGITAANLADTETSSNNTARAYADWTDFAWGYRVPIDITGNGTLLTNYQLKVTVNTAALVTALKMQADGDDIRFATTAAASLDYWIDTGMNTASTVIWVEVGSIAASGTTRIYMYYGNASATIASNGDNVFIYFDDFETAGDVTEWTEQNAGAGRSRTLSSAQYTHGANSMYIDDGSAASTYGVYVGFTAQSGTFAVDFDIRPVQNNDWWEMQLRSTANIGPELRLADDTAGSDVEYKVGAAWSNLPTAVGYSANTWYRYTLDDVKTQGSPNDTYDVWINGTQYANDIRWVANRTNANRVYFISGAAAEIPKVYVDTVRVRQYQASVPAYSIGSEQ